MDVDLKMIFAFVDLYRNAKATYQGIKHNKAQKNNPRFMKSRRRPTPPRRRSIWI